MFDGGNEYFKSIMEGVYRGGVGCGSGTVVIIIIGATFHPLARILWKSESYLAYLEATSLGENLSLQ
jgi:hypothetical protein